MTEQEIHISLIRHLNVRGVPLTSYFHVPNGGHRSPVEAAVLKGMGTRSGVPDLVLIKEGRLFALELKAEKGRLSPTQVLMLEEMRCAGATVEVAYGLDAAIAVLETWGFLRQARQMPTTRVLVEAQA